MTNVFAEVTIVINRPSVEVWEYVVDPANLHTWVKDIDSPGSWIVASGSDAGGPNVGSRYRIDYEYGRKTNEIIFEVTAAEPGTRFSTNTVKGPYPITVDYVFLESENDDSTKLTIAMDARFDSLFTAVLLLLTGWFAKWFMKKRLRSELSDLKRAIESR